MKRSIELLEQLAARSSAANGERYLALIAAIREYESSIKSYTERAARIGEMETELIDSKIAARIEGLTTDRMRGEDPIAAAESHVEGVLRPSEFGRMLQRSARELEEEIEERKLTSRAKAVLESEYGMTEEQAHLHLRALSRKNRRPLGEVARELIEAGNSLRSPIWMNRL